MFSRPDLNKALLPIAVELVGQDKADDLISETLNLHPVTESDPYGDQLSRARFHLKITALKHLADGSSDFHSSLDKRKGPGPILPPDYDSGDKAGLGISLDASGDKAD